MLLHHRYLGTHCIIHEYTLHMLKVLFPFHCHTLYNIIDPYSAAQKVRHLVYKYILPNSSSKYCFPNTPVMSDGLWHWKHIGIPFEVHLKGAQVHLSHSSTFGVHLRYLNTFKVHSEYI